MALSMASMVKLFPVASPPWITRVRGLGELCYNKISVRA